MDYVPKSYILDFLFELNQKVREFRINPESVLIIDRDKVSG